MSELARHPIAPCTHLRCSPDSAGDRGALAIVSADMSSEERLRAHEADGPLPGLLQGGAPASEKRLMARWSCMPACLPVKGERTGLEEGTGVRGV